MKNFILAAGAALFVLSAPAFAGGLCIGCTHTKNTQAEFYGGSDAYGGGIAAAYGRRSQAGSEGFYYTDTVGEAANGKKGPSTFVGSAAGGYQNNWAAARGPGLSAAGTLGGVSSSAGGGVSKNSWHSLKKK